MSKAKARKGMPRLKVEFTTRPATAATRQSLHRFWERLLASQREVNNGQ